MLKPTIEQRYKDLQLEAIAENLMYEISELLYAEGNVPPIVVDNILDRVGRYLQTETLPMVRRLT